MSEELVQAWEDYRLERLEAAEAEAFRAGWMARGNKLPCEKPDPEVGTIQWAIEQLKMERQVGHKRGTEYVQLRPPHEGPDGQTFNLVWGDLIATNWEIVPMRDPYFGMSPYVTPPNREGLIPNPETPDSPCDCP